MGNRADERPDARQAPDVRRGDSRHEAKDQSSRYREDLGSPDQVCLFRQRLLTVGADGPQDPSPWQSKERDHDRSAFQRGLTHDARDRRFEKHAQGR
jgi:hypothetical protein